MKQLAFQANLPLNSQRHNLQTKLHQSQNANRSTPKCVSGPNRRVPSPASQRKGTKQDPYDAIVIGSGLGGLCTGALLATHSKKIVVLESHTTIGGAAQSFQRRTADGTFTFEAGPHLFSGLTMPSRNPLAHVVQATNTNLPIRHYDQWGVFIGGDFTATTVRRSKPFLQALIAKYGGPSAQAEMNRLLEDMRPLGELATLLPPALLRADDLFGSLRMLLPRVLRRDVLPLLPNARELSRPFAPFLHARVRDPFVRRFVNLLCFLLAGVQADRIPVAEVAFMFREWVGEGVDDSVLQHPIGGASGIAQALGGVIDNSDNESSVRTRCRVQKVMTDATGCATGVVLASGERVYASSVVSNASALDMPDLLPEGFEHVRADVEKRDMCESFMHLNFAIRLSKDVRSGIAGGELLSNYVNVEDWGLGVEARDNVVLVSIPSVLDSDVCPEGFAVVHAYTPATEPFADWANLERGTAEYERFKEVRAGILWKAVNKIFGCDVRAKTDLVMVASPKSHAFFVNRQRGSYGPRVDAREGLLGLPFPSSKGLPKGFICVGDGVFPGVGVPAVAGSAWLVANSLVSVQQQESLLRRSNI